MRTTGNSEKMLIKNALKWQRMARLAWKMSKEWGGRKLKEGRKRVLINMARREFAQRDLKVGEGQMIILPVFIYMQMKYIEGGCWHKFIPILGCGGITLKIEESSFEEVI